jgi:hypothetical protein
MKVAAVSCRKNFVRDITFIDTCWWNVNGLWLHWGDIQFTIAKEAAMMQTLLQCAHVAC